MTDTSGAPSDEEPTIKARTQELLPEEASNSVNERVGEEAPTVQIVPQDLPVTLDVGALTAQTPVPPALSQEYEHFGDIGEQIPYQPFPYQSLPAATPTGVLPPAYDQVAFYAQGANALPPSQLFPGQLVQVPKKGRKLLWIIAAVVAILLVGGGTIFAISVVQASSSTPAKTLQQFCDGFKTLNAGEVYNTLTTDSQQQVSLTQLQQTFDEIKSIGVKYSDCTVSDIQQNGSTATAKVTIAISVSYQGSSFSMPLSLPVSLAQENGQWKIEGGSMSTPNFQMPTLPPDFLTPTASY
jgi:hypothetical protein